MAGFLEKFPWPERYANAPKPLEWLWTIPIRATPAGVWPLLSDTSRMNRSMGLPVMEYKEIDGLLYGKTNYWGVPTEWVEQPWEWVHGRSLVCVRDYSRGFATAFRGIAYLEPTPAGAGAFVHLYFAWIPRNFFWRVFLRRAFPKLERTYRKAIARIDQSVAEKNDALAFRRPATVLPEGTGARIAAIDAALDAQGISPGLRERICDFVQTGDDMDLARVRVIPLAARWGVPETELLTALLHATREGLFNLTWDVICPHCRGVRAAADRLSKLPRRGRCDVCEIDFATDTEHAIEVTFHIHPSFRSTPKLEFCAAEPAKRQHIKLQGLVAPGRAVSVQPLLAPGRYRLRAIGAEGAHTLDVLESAGRPQVAFSVPGDGAHLQADPDPVVAVSNPGPQPRRFVLEEVQWKDLALRPSRLFSLQEFHDLFSEEYLDADVQLNVGEQTIMFTDIVGSSGLFRRDGDARAFTRVKEHFAYVHDLARNHGGAVIKTIGDATLAAFHSPLHALRAAAELQRHTASIPEVQRINVRIAINAGVCIAVNLNKQIDYFGKTVIIASRLQKQAGAGDVVLSENVFHAAGVSEWLRGERLEPQRLAVELPELDTSLAAFKVRP